MDSSSRLLIKGFEVVFPGDIGPDPGDTGGSRIEPDQVAPLPAAAVGGVAVEPANDQAPIGRFAIGDPAEAIAVVEARRFDLGEGGRQVSRWREVQMARVKGVPKGSMDDLKLARSLLLKGLSHGEGNSWVLAKVSLAAKQG